MRLNKEVVEDIVSRIDPDTFITLSVKQCLPATVGPLYVGNPERYDRAMRTTLKAVHRQVYGKRQSRRKRHLFKNISTLERAYGGRWHIHCCLKRPDHVNIEQFRMIFLQCWEKSNWYMPHNEVVQMTGGAAYYILKMGQDSILTTASQF